MLTFMTAVLAALSPCVSAPPLVRVDEEPTLERRLEILVERMEAERISNHIPGLALAVVKDDEVILARGFGLADIETGRPVEADTLFAIGSSTKAFTAAVIGMLQDEGVMDFDDPVTEYLPAFELQIEGPDEDGDSTVTVRDLLAHRTGFTRMSLLWGGGTVPRSRVLEVAIKAEPWAGFREQFLYNNVMYMAAGMSSAAATDAEWEELVEARIFAPLGMSSSNLSVLDAQQDERLSLGYEWNSDTESYDRKVMLNLKSIGPAGSINSNVEDMAQWIRLQLGRGEYEGERLISEAALNETWSPQMPMGNDTYYGLGWMLHEHNGERVIEHGGNIDGFGAAVAFMPDAGVGFVLLTNVTATPLQQTSIAIVFDTLLGELDESGAPAEDFDEYIGTYIANFASFKDVDFDVSVTNGNLAVDVPGQMNFELKAPDEEGKRYFLLTDTVAISFDRNDEGVVVGMQMHQAGMNFELPRDGVELEAEIPLAELARFLGTYKHPTKDMLVEVVIQNQRLAMDVPDQMVFELRAPDAEGKRQFRVIDHAAVRFNEDEAGAVVSITTFEKDKQREFARVSASEAQPSELPTLAEVLALREPGGRAQLLAEHGTLRTTGTVAMLQAGLEGTYTFEARRDPRAFRGRMDFGEFGVMQFGAAGETAWSFNTAQGHTELSGVQARQMLRRHPSLMEGDWREAFDSLEVREVEQPEEDGGHELILIKATWSDLPSMTFYVDAETGEVARVDTIIDAGIVKLPRQTTFDDFREMEGVELYHTLVEQTDWTGRTVQTLVSLEAGVELAPDFHEFDGAGE